MPAGDAHRIWFPEMVDMLRRDWSDSLSCEEVVGLRDRLDDTLQRIRTERKILPPVIYCNRCGARHRAAPPKVSVRALILALARFGIASEPEVKELERGWNENRKSYGLDLYGKHGSSAGQGADL